MIPLFHGEHWHVDLYVSPWYWTAGVAYDSTACGCVKTFDMLVPFLVLQVGYIKDEYWDDEAVWEPTPQEDCGACGYENVQNGECAICGWNKNGQK